MKQFALIGNPLGHSLSPALHKAIYRQLEMDDASYRTVELTEEQLKIFFMGFRAGGFDGINVTVPHKSAIVDYLHHIEPHAKIIDAVNCINRDGRQLIGHNTDILGFEYLLEHANIDIKNQDCVIIGAGGSARAVAFVLAQKGAKCITVANRSEENAKQIIAIIQKISSDIQTKIVTLEQAETSCESSVIWVNTTPVGMSPYSDKSPIKVKHLSEKSTVIDLIYNPSETQLLQQAKKLGAKTVNGIIMLVAQAVFAVEIWMGGNIVNHIDMNALIKELERQAL